jgi:hypothetical protein
MKNETKAGLVILLLITALICCGFYAVERQRREQAGIKAEQTLLHENLIRAAAFHVLENKLVQMGVDATVGGIGDASTPTNQHMVIVGPGVTHLFMRQFAAGSGMRSALTKVGFLDVTFMVDKFTWVGTWNLANNTLE